MDVWGEILTQAPAVAAVVYISSLFLREIRSMRKEDVSARQEFAQSLTHIGESCHAHSEKLTDKATAALDRNTEVLGKTHEVIRHTLEKISHR